MATALLEGEGPTSARPSSAAASAASCPFTAAAAEDVSVMLVADIASSFRWSPASSSWPAPDCHATGEAYIGGG